MIIGERITLTNAQCFRYTTHERRLCGGEVDRVYHRYVFRVWGEDAFFVYSGVHLPGVKEGEGYNLRATLKRDERSTFKCWRLARVKVIVAETKAGDLL